MTETQTRPRLQGNFEWYDAKSIHIQARFDKVAVHQNRLMFISLVAFSQDVKAIRAGLAAGLSSPMRLGNVTLTSGRRVDRPERRLALAAGLPGRCPPAGLRLAPRPLHLPPAGLPAQRQRRRAVAGAEAGAVHHAACSGAGCPTSAGELVIRNLLHRCHTLDCSCCILTALSADLDSIVESGLKNGSITIEPGDQN